MPTCLISIEESQWSLRLLLAKRMCIISIYENNLLLWPTFSLLSRERKGGYMQYQLITAMAFSSYFRWDFNYHTLNDNHQNLKIAYFGHAMAKKWPTNHALLFVKTHVWTSHIHTHIIYIYIYTYNGEFYYDYIIIACYFISKLARNTIFVLFFLGKKPEIHSSLKNII